jgi:3-deoxy-D-manno-octulosonic-acid transferase
MSLAETVYQAALRAGQPLLRVASAFNEKVARGVAGRRGAAARLEQWGRTTRDARCPLLWFHAPSVGEALMAQATIEAARAQCPGAQVVFTFFSPSAERVADRVGADIATYLPLDLTNELAPALDALHPSVIAFVRTEVWPTLSREAQKRNVPLVLVNAVLSEGSSRLRPMAKLLLRATYRRLAAVGAVGEEDASRFEELGVASNRVIVTGDARFDQVWRRTQQLERDAPLLRALRGDSPLFVAGSTWPADEAVLIEAFTDTVQRLPLRLAIVPHEPTPAHISRLETALHAAGVAHVRIGAIEDGGHNAANVIIVDRVGLLADLYAAATIAYVGGGFGRAGLHSIVEPAALGTPVLFGPRHGNAREANELARAGGGFEIAGAPDISAKMIALATHPDDHARASEAAVAYVRSRLGGAVRNASLVVARSARLTGVRAAG